MSSNVLEDLRGSRHDEDWLVRLALCFGGAACIKVACNMSRADDCL